MTPTIREAEPRDRERLIALFQVLNCHEDSLTGDRRRDWVGAEESLAESETEVAKCEGFFLVAESDGRVIGLLTLTFGEGPVFLRPEARPYAHIGDLVVDEAWRRRGIAAELMTAAEERCARRGFTRLTIGVLAGNALAEAAYRRQGFQSLGHNLVKILGNV